jgi:hypothetical protein
LRKLAALVEDLLIGKPTQLDQRKAYLTSLGQHRRQVTNDILKVVTSAGVSFSISSSAQLSESTEDYFGNWKNWSPIKLFCDDVARLLRQLYGNIDPILLWNISESISSIVLEDAKNKEPAPAAIRDGMLEEEELWFLLHCNALIIARGAHIAFEEGLPIMQRQPIVNENLRIVREKCMQIAREKPRLYLKLIDAAKAIHYNNMFAREVLGDPSGLSKYTVKFATIWQSTNPPDIWP